MNFLIDNIFFKDVGINNFANKNIIIICFGTTDLISQIRNFLSLINSNIN